MVWALVGICLIIEALYLIRKEIVKTREANSPEAKRIAEEWANRAKYLEEQEGRERLYLMDERTGELIRNPRRIVAGEHNSQQSG